MIRLLEERIVKGGNITPAEAGFLTGISGPDIFELFASANRIRNSARGNRIDLCSILNAKSGACPEDCAYCAQSVHSSAEIQKFPLLDKNSVLEKAREAKDGGAKRFCIVTSGKRVTEKELSSIGRMIAGVREIGLLPCATLGLLSKGDLVFLRDSGLERYHHNLETSERFFSRICGTHSYRDKLTTIEAVKSVGLSLCSGGIFGLGETWQDRIDMGFALAGIEPDSVPINFLIPIKGTALGTQKKLEPLEALRIVSLYRFIVPGKEIRVCGGRIQTLGDLNSFIFFAGADGLLTGNYLTTPGRGFGDDLRLIAQLGFSR